jgi:acetyl-CoA acyltransferase
MSPNDAVIVSAVRTAVARGKKDGSLANVHPVDLSAEVLKTAVGRAGITPSDIDDVIWGCAMPEASQGLNVARLSVLRAGFPVEVPATTVNRFCSSGLQTVAMAAQAIMSGMAETVVAGGVEMMSQVPMSGFHTRLNPAMTESYIGMGFTAERVAERWKVSREDQDAWALGSHQKAAQAWQAGRFADQIVPIKSDRANGGGAVESIEFCRDELVRTDTTAEKLAKLQPAFKLGGTVTAGNASPYSDGAAGLVVMKRAKAESLGITPLARFVTFAAAGVEPDIMGVGPIKAVPKALRLAGMSLADIDLIEFNEAFASQILASMRDLGMPEDRVNVNGGAIALGHPLGATGAKLTTQLIHELRRRGGGRGLVTMCVGGGMGAAGIFEVAA